MVSAAPQPARCAVTLDGHRCYMVADHPGDHFSSDSMRYTVLHKPSAGERISDDRLAFFAEDRTGFRLKFFADGITTDEALGLVDELRAWRKHKLGDDEKEALRTAREMFAGADTKEAAKGNTEDVHEAAWRAIDRIAGKKS